MYKTVKPTTFTLPLDILDDLSVMAKELGKKKTAIVTEALGMYMDFQDLKEVEKRLEESNGEYLSGDEFWKMVEK
jgi:predicted DNA-binding protein